MMFTTWKKVSVALLAAAIALPSAATAAYTMKVYNCSHSPIKVVFKNACLGGMGTKVASTTVNGYQGSAKHTFGSGTVNQCVTVTTQDAKFDQNTSTSSSTAHRSTSKTGQTENINFVIDGSNVKTKHSNEGNCYL